MKVEIWSDIVCPWCYVGKRRFEAALARFAHRDEVEVVWRAFELDRSAPRQLEGPYVERIAGKYGLSVTEAQAMVDRMVSAGAGDGLALRFDIARPGNTFDAHRLLHLAAHHGVQHELKERLLAATFAEAEPIGDPDTLVRLAAGAGLDAHEARSVLKSDRYAAEVRLDEQRASRLGINAVPFFVFEGRYGVAGAQPPDVLLGVLTDTWAETRAEGLVVTGGPSPDPGADCSGDACDVP